MSAFSNFKGFINEVIVELKRCTWPTWPELRRHSIIVIIAMFIVGIFVGIICDVPLRNLVGLLTGS